MSIYAPASPCFKARTSGVVNKTSPIRRTVTTRIRGLAESLISRFTISLAYLTVAVSRAACAAFALAASEANCF
jgi:hypothetical protein